ncbi:MAG: hypothetical protein IJU57_00880 [Clostridia bacterium]|nr:hypothetical protein [Clostridia bacterium]
MDVKIEKRYLLLPVGRNEKTKKICLIKNGKVCAELKTRLSESPDFTIPYDVSGFLGETLEIRTDPESGYCPVFADSFEDPGLFREKLRPVSHFSAAYGWINDPNGPVWYEGKYHLFFQHNPTDSLFGNIHWGHATSTDLVHWTQHDEALFPDETGLMYSGCAFVDSKNVTGLRKDGHDPLLLFYTAAGGDSGLSAGHHYTQRLAYSADGGRTFIKHCAVVDIPEISGNRDPKVVFCEDIDKYVMVLYLDRWDFMLLASEDLIHWNELQRIELEGDRECPDFFPLSANGEKYWVLTGGSDLYVAGQFENGLYRVRFPKKQLNFSRESYAGHSFANVPGGRILRICWNRSPIPDMPFNGSMTTPQELHLEDTENGPALSVSPCAEFGSLRGDPVTGRGALDLPGRSNDILISVKADKKRAMKLFGLTFHTDPEARLLSMKNGPSIPAETVNGRMSFRIIQDIHSFEIYSAGGKAYACIGFISEGKPGPVKCPGAEITAYPLSDIHF